MTDYTWLINEGIKSIVGDVLLKQHQMSTNLYSRDSLRTYLPVISLKDYKRLRRGVRWIQTRAGRDKTISDDELKEVLKKLGVAVR